MPKLESSTPFYEAYHHVITNPLHSLLSLDFTPSLYLYNLIQATISHLAYSSCFSNLS